MSFQLLGNTKSLTHPHTSSQEHSTTALANAVRSAHVPGAKPQEMGGGGENCCANQYHQPNDNLTASFRVLKDM